MDEFDFTSYPLTEGTKFPFNEGTLEAKEKLERDMKFQLCDNSHSIQRPVLVQSGNTRSER
ncbi:hypothetical protein pdam_00006938, partial [Pocillopora damicornis]|uniref:Uncharacterized protein n=2 Tax=Pocillopora TaxID=46730 RepID=A0AAU9VN30_9CNID